MRQAVPVTVDGAGKTVAASELVSAASCALRSRHVTATRLPRHRHVTATKIATKNAGHVKPPQVRLDRHATAAYKPPG